MRIKLDENIPASAGTRLAALGFDVVPDEDLTPALRRIRDEEAARGLTRWPRVMMRRPLEEER